MDETLIRLKDDLYWLYMAVDSDTNNVLHTKLHPTRNHYTAKDSMLGFIEKHDLDESLFLLMDSLPYTMPVAINPSDFGTKNMEIETPSNASSEN